MVGCPSRRHFVVDGPLRPGNTRRANGPHAVERMTTAADMSVAKPKKTPETLAAVSKLAKRLLADRQRGRLADRAMYNVCCNARGGFIRRSDMTCSTAWRSLKRRRRLCPPCRNWPSDCLQIANAADCVAAAGWGCFESFPVFVDCSESIRKHPETRIQKNTCRRLRSSARSSVEIIRATQHGSSWFDVPERFPSPPPPLANPYRLVDRLQRTGTKPSSAICPLETDTQRRQRSF